MIGIGIGIPFIKASGGAAPFVGLLDLYPNAAAAYSIRKLRNAYLGSAVRIRRSGDNAETDIGFLNNEFDTAAAQTFCINGGGTQNGFITKWYDQSGNNYDVEQTTAAKQPQLIVIGVILTKNSKPCPKFTTSQELLSPSNFNLTLTDTSLFSVMQLGLPTETISFGWGKAFNALKIRYFYESVNNLGFALWTNDAVSTINVTDTNINQYTAIQTTNVVLSKNATTQTRAFGSNPLTTDNGSFGINGIQGGSSTSLNSNIDFCEGVFYSSDKTTDSAGIKLNQKTYYGTP